MKQFKTTSIFAALVIAFLTYIWFFEIQKGKEEEKKKENEQIVFGWDSKSLKSLEVQATGKEAFILENQNGSWKVSKPVEDQADEMALTGFIADLMSRKTELVAEELTGKPEKKEEEEKKLEMYGLLNPAGHITAISQDQKKIEVQIGSKKAFGEKSYIRKITSDPNDQRKIYVAMSAWPSDLEKNIRFFRDKKVIRESLKEAQEISFKADSKTFELKKADGKWVFSNGKETVDQERVSKFFSQMEGLLASDFIEPEEKQSAQLKKLGLDKAALTYVFQFSNEKKIKLEISKVKEGQLFIKNSLQKSFFQVDVFVLESLFKKQQDFYDGKKPFQFDPNLVKKAIFATENFNYEMSFKDSNWKADKIVERHKEEKELDSALMTTWLVLLSSQKAEKYGFQEFYDNIQKSKNKIELRDEKGGRIFTARWIKHPKEALKILLVAEPSKDVMEVMSTEFGKVTEFNLFKPKGGPSGTPAGEKSP